VENFEDERSQGQGRDFAEKPGLKPPGDRPHHQQPGIWDTRKEDGRAIPSGVPTSAVDEVQDADAGQGNTGTSDTPV
jgi:hypothetical protein